MKNLTMARTWVGEGKGASAKPRRWAMPGKCQVVLMMVFAVFAALARMVPDLPKDGVTPVTAALQAAIDAASAAGGDTVVLGAGRYRSGHVELKDNVTLRLEKGATILAIRDWNQQMPSSARVAALKQRLGCPEPALTKVATLIGAYGVRNIAIEGEGTIDGQGLGIPGKDGTALRWKDVYCYRCGNVRVEGVTLRDPASWTCYFRECDGVVARRVTIRSHVNHNNDGFDIEAKNVLIEDCDVDATDDAFCFKSDNADFAVENCVVRNCKASSACNFIKFGTSSCGTYRNIKVHDMELSARGQSPVWDWRKVIPWAGVTNRVCGIAGIALEVVDGGRMENVTVRNVHMASGVQTPIVVRMARRRVGKGETYLRNILIENITGMAVSRIASQITGVAASERGPLLRPENITIRNVNLTMPGGGTEIDVHPPKGVPEVEKSYPENRMFGVNLPAWGFYVRHAKNVVFENVKLSLASPDARPEYVKVDVICGGTDPKAQVARLDFDAIPEVRILKGGEDRSLRDVAAIYHDGVFHIYLSLIEHDREGNVFWYTAQTESRDLVHWTEFEKITPKDQNLNFSSPGNVVRFRDEWVLCLQTYPIPGCKITHVGKRTRYGNENARLWIMRSRDLRHWGKPEMLRVIPGCEVPFAKGMRMIDPYLIEDTADRGLWWCFFKRHGEIQYSASRDLVNWEFKGRSGCIGENPTVLRVDGEYLLVYSPANGTSFAKSKDLRHWEKVPGVVTLGQQNWEWGRRGRLSAATVLDCRANPEVGKFVMFFHCTKVPELDGMYNHCSIGIAWSDDLKTWHWPSCPCRSRQAR